MFGVAQGTAASQPLLALVSLHGGHHNKTPGEAFGRVEASSPWTQAELPLDALIDHIASGKAFVNALLNGARSNENCLASNLIILDVDGDLTLEEFWAIPFAQRHCAFTYTSCSHLSDAKQQERGSRTNHSFRALFPAERVDLTTAEGQALYAERYHLLLERLGISLKDSSPAKPAQLWFGNTAAEFQFGQGIPLDWEFSADAADRLKAKALQRQQLQQQAAPRLDDDGLDEQRAVYLLDHLLRPSADGEFSDYWVKVFNACAASGSELVREAFLAWHGRGHHSKTQKRVDKRYDKAGHRSGLGALFALAKEQHGSEWYKLLPPELQRKGQAPPQPRVLFSKPSPHLGLNIIQDIPPARPELDRGAVTDELSREAAQVVYSRRASEQDPPGKGDGKDGKDAAAYAGNLIHQLFLLRAYGQREVDGQIELVPSHQQAELDRLLLGAILECRGYANSLAEVELDLIKHLRWRLGLASNQWAPVASKILKGNPKLRAEWLIPNWILAKRDHVIYSKPAVGKTTLAIQLARAITGDPSLNEFLDSGPISGHDRWRRSRVLFISSDMGDAAEEMTETYLADLGLTDAPFLEYVDWWLQDSETNSPAWTLSMRHLLQLYTHLESNHTAGTPVTAVIIDSMKAVCPDGLLVGHQAFKDYLGLVYDICTHFNSALVWIHHASGNSTGPQGIQRIIEAPSAVFKMEKNEQRQIFIDVEKLRAGRGRKLMIDPFRRGAPALLANADIQPVEPDDEPVLTKHERRMQDILQILQQHLADYRRDNPEETGARLALLYKGMSVKQIQELYPQASAKVIRNDLQGLCASGEAEQKGHSNTVTYRVRLQDNGEPAERYDLFTAGW